MSKHTPRPSADEPLVSRPDGPVESYAWPTTLEARVVSPGPAPRLHGYDVGTDLAVHYSFVDGFLLALTGELPSEASRSAAEVALLSLGPLSAAHAPTHAAVLAKVCGARFSSICAISAIALAERARTISDDMQPLLDWLADDGSAPPPPSLLSTDESDRAAVNHLRAALSARQVSVPVLEQHEFRPLAALLATLHYAGLTHPEQLQAALVVASFAPVLAEARWRAVASFRDYPMQVPPFVYEETDARRR